ncbi:MAG TPA: alternative ribosome rescue aminoacyl-tRNA hydrolase ArfB [Myxococcota bacterium]|nr:alternative ribosome rescue aminoacyl-tRNA hydrolase ArfB [Myxococcota bacterium]HRY96211.1 alternative ribosome rescue aminoacyl-tRNA hydrolase ArfB [Myxococcota bacterium]HSA22053.1 alternative ribosome rescue aminoacyl-tRNA hydrolase ArfB [Myxococcota bacterium]
MDLDGAFLEVSASLRIPRAELEFTFARSSGAGGQNVNKVNSKAVLRWDLRHSPSLPPGVRARFLARFGSRVTREGELVLASEEHRDQARNIEACLEKLTDMLRAVERPPKPRRPTRPSAGQKRRRLADKRHQKTKKTLRRGGGQEGAD